MECNAVSPLDTDRRFRGIYCYCNLGETSVGIYQNIHGAVTKTEDSRCEPEISQSFNYFCMKFKNPTVTMSCGCPQSFFPVSVIMNPQRANHDKRKINNLNDNYLELRSFSVRKSY